MRFRNLVLSFFLAGTLAAHAQSTGAGEGAAVEKLNPAIGRIGSMELLDNKYTLGPGDKVSFRVVEEREEPIVLQVSSSGELEIPFIGRVSAQGLTCLQLARRIKTELEKDYYRKATVIIGVESTSTAPLGIVYVTGQVGAQGPIEITRDEKLTVSKAILRAGGFADFANKRRVRLIRENPDGSKAERMIVDVKAVLEGGQLEKDVVLKPGDFIVVPERGINF